MNKYDEQFFARHALGAGTDFEWDDPYDDDPSLPFDADISPESDDLPVEDDLLFEEE
jgi:hypothetical protein